MPDKPIHPVGKTATFGGKQLIYGPDQEKRLSRGRRPRIT